MERMASKKKLAERNGAWENWNEEGGVKKRRATQHEKRARGREEDLEGPWGRTMAE